MDSGNPGGNAAYGWRRRCRPGCWAWTRRGRKANFEPDEISKKSLKVLDKKLQWLAEYADFHVNINSVVGGGIKDPQDALTIGRRAIELGFTSTIGIIHDGSGQLKPLQPEERQVYRRMKSFEKKARIVWRMKSVDVTRVMPKR